MLQSAKADSVGQIPSGLFIVAVSDPTTKSIDGYLASWVQQVSFSPLMVSIAIKPGRPAYELIKSGRNFAINIVGEHDKTFLKHFWKGYDPELNPFKEIPHEMGDNGGVLIKGAKASLECKFSSSITPGDHDVFFAEVLASYLMNDEARPMVHLRKSGASY